MCVFCVNGCSSDARSLSKVLGDSKQIWSRADSYGLPTSRPVTVHYMQHTGVLFLFMTLRPSLPLLDFGAAHSITGKTRVYPSFFRLDKASLPNHLCFHTYTHIWCLPTSVAEYVRVT